MTNQNIESITIWCCALIRRVEIPDIDFKRIILEMQLILTIIVITTIIYVSLKSQSENILFIYE